MTIIDSKESWSNSSINRTSSDGRSYTISATRGFSVTHSADETDIVISRAPGINVRARHPTIQAFCTGIRTERLGPVYTMVLFDYSGETGPGDGGNEGNDSPILTPPEYIWSTETVQANVDEDYAGDPICTANKERYENVTKDISDTVLTVTRNFSLHDPTVMDEYLDATNSDLFANYQPGRCKFMGYTASLQYAPTFQYWRVQAKIKMRKRGKASSVARTWWYRTLHKGFKVKDATSGLIVNATDEFESPSTQPVLLAADGKKLAAGADAVWKEFKLYDSKPFAALGLI